MSLTVNEQNRRRQSANSLPQIDAGHQTASKLGVVNVELLNAKMDLQQQPRLSGLRP